MRASACTDLGGYAKGDGASCCYLLGSIGNFIRSFICWSAGSVAYVCPDTRYRNIARGSCQIWVRSPINCFVLSMQLVSS